ncbi:MAG: inositol monophosphatase family protein [Desulfobulbus sp.]|jgi:myo-inositol-1(or 4)-monophosphatase|nr:inositol monophosphatase family protein [Desulfobulbus sp.]
MQRTTAAAASCTSSDQRHLLTAACRAALQAGAILRARYEQPHEITMKGTINLVTEADLSAEEVIVALLSAETPGVAVMTEETEATHSLEQSGRFWVVDPLDGTTNFAHGFPFFAVSIALLDNGRPQAAAIYLPILDELFCSANGAGAWLNGQPIRVTDTTKLIASLVATGFPYEIERNLPQVMRHLGAMLPRVRDIRRAGAAAVDLAYVACGRLDGFYEMCLQPWDTAAGWLLIEEAGGRVSDFAGSPYSVFHPEILASNGGLHDCLQALLNE